MSIVALMTDFGTRDHYVASMKGMILQIDPKVVLVDITHEIGSQDLYHGAFVLRQVFPCFPARTIFVAVVDPGVGTGRRILAAQYNDRIVVAPDNGLITLLQRDADLQELHVVENRRYFASGLSSTFHGRDVFAPLAGHLSRGVPLASVGPPTDRLEVLELTRPRLNPDGSIDGEVVLIDNFGNLITNVSELDLSATRTTHTLEVFLGPVRVGPIRTTYATVPPGEPVAVIGSARMVEIAVNGGSAAARLNVRRGQPISLRAMGSA
jgi:S-adenosylmethionine hydrolase